MSRMTTSKLSKDIQKIGLSQPPSRQSEQWHARVHPYPSKLTNTISLISCYHRGKVSICVWERFRERISRIVQGSQRALHENMAEHCRELAFVYRTSFRSASAILPFGASIQNKTVRVLIREMSSKRDKKYYQSDSHLSDSSSSDSPIEPTLRGEEESMRATEKTKRSMKVPIVVKKERYDAAGDNTAGDNTAGPSTNVIDFDSPKCVLPEHYFDALAHRHSTSPEGEDVRQLLSIETWDGRKIVSWDEPE